MSILHLHFSLALNSFSGDNIFSGIHFHSGGYSQVNINDANLETLCTIAVGLYSKNRILTKLIKINTNGIRQHLDSFRRTLFKWK